MYSMIVLIACMVLQVDGGEGRFYNSSTLHRALPNNHLHIRVSQRSLFAGGDVKFSSSNSIVMVDDDFKDSEYNIILYCFVCI